MKETLIDNHTIQANKGKLNAQLALEHIVELVMQLEK